MTLPGDRSLTVEVAFVDDPFDTTLTWDDITSVVQTVTITRGRTSSLDLFTAGTCRIVVADKVRDFDPTNTAGAYYTGGATEVLPNKQVRVTANDSGATTRTLFRGFIAAQDGFQYDYTTDPSHTLVTLNCYDLIGVIARYELDPVDPAAYEEGSGARVTRVLDDIGIPSAWQDVDTGISTMQNTEWGENALAHINKVVQSEGGAFYVTAAGVATFDNRHAVIQATRMNTAQQTFSDDGSDVDYDHGSLLTSYATEVRNHIFVGRVGGTVQEEEDATSITAYTETAMSRTGLLHNNDNESKAAAEWFLAQYKDPVFTPAAITISPLRSNGELDEATQRALRDRINVEYTPPNTGDNAQIDKDCFIERIVHQIDQNDWRTTFGLSSAERFGFATYSQFLELDVGHLDSSTTARLAY